MTTRRVFSVTVGLLIGLLIWAGSLTLGGASPTEGGRSALRTIDFNQPAMLAWSLQLPGPGSDTLRHARCSARGLHVFICHGEAANGAEATIRILVASNGSKFVVEDEVVLGASNQGSSVATLTRGPAGVQEGRTP